MRSCFFVGEQRLCEGLEVMTGLGRRFAWVAQRWRPTHVFARAAATIIYPELAVHKDSVCIVFFHDATSNRARDDFG